MKNLIILFVLALMNLTVLAGGDNGLKQTNEQYSKKFEYKEPQRVRKIKYDPEYSYYIYASVRNTTCIVLPQNEKIASFTCGNKEWWPVDGNYNFAYFKPGKAGDKTNLNLVCFSGNVYSFVLQEISNIPEITEPDYKIIVEPKNSKLLTNINKKGNDRFVEKAELDSYKAQVKYLSKQILINQQQTKKEVEKKIDNFKNQYPIKLNFDYKFEMDKKPFKIISIYHDDKFTYIKCNATETPAIYEYKDRKGNLINFQFENNTYIIPKIVDKGYLQIGKKKCKFEKRG